MSGSSKSARRRRRAAVHAVTPRNEAAAPAPTDAGPGRSGRGAAVGGSRAGTASRGVRAGAGSRARSASGSGGQFDLVAAYRDAPGHGRPLRLGVLAGLVLLDVYTAMRVGHNTPPPIIGNLAVGCLFAFYGVVMFNYFRVIHRVRREDPKAWRPSLRLMAQMLGAPLGVGNPRATLFDRTVLRLTVAAALLLLPLTVVGSR